MNISPIEICIIIFLVYMFFSFRKAIIHLAQEIDKINDSISRK